MQHQVLAERLRSPAFNAAAQRCHRRRGGRPAAAGRRMFWLSAAATATVLGGGYAVHAAWVPAVDGGTMVLNTIFLPTGDRPVAVADGARVTVAWRAGGDAGDLPALRYVVMRRGGSGAAQACVVTTTTCRDIGVPPGTWRYTVRPDLGKWQGREGPPGTPVTVPARATAAGTGGAVPTNAPAVQVLGDRPQTP